MAIHPPESKIWWNERIERGELVWIGIAFLWGLIMFSMMIYWHIEGNQNLSNEAYRIDPKVFEQRTEDFTKKFKVREDANTGYPVAKPPAFMRCARSLVLRGHRQRTGPPTLRETQNPSARSIEAVRSEG